MSTPPNQKASPKVIAVLSTGLIILCVVLYTIVYVILDRCSEYTEGLLILLVLVSGGIGSFIHAAQSFTAYAGLKNLKKSWIPWYILRPFIGTGLALIFYFLYRSVSESFALETLLTPDGRKELFFILASASLVGLFSRPAINKLGDVFETIFNSETDKKMKTLDRVNNSIYNKPDADFEDRNAKG